jgi:hypothetical protein
MGRFKEARKTTEPIPAARQVGIKLAGKYFSGV